MIAESRRDERVAMARGAAFLFGAGAVLVVVTLAFPYHDVDLPGVLVPVALASAVAVALVRRPRLLRPRDYPAVLALGAVLVSCCIAFGGNAAGAYAFMYVWVALYAAHFFTSRMVVIQMAFAGGLGIAGFEIDGITQAPEAHWLMALGVATVTAALVGSLTRRARGQRNDLERAAAMASGLVDPVGFAGLVCEALERSARADVTAVLEPLDDAEGLRVTGLRGTEEAALIFTRSEARESLQQAYRQSRRSLILTGGRRSRALSFREGTVIGLAQPIVRDGRAAGVLALAWLRPRQWLPERASAAALVFAAQASVAMERVERLNRDRERQALEINDNIVQGLAVAKYAIAQGMLEEGTRAIDETLARARRLITEQLNEIVREPGGVIRPGDLVRGEASRLEAL
jgi:hypothetical protein